MKTGFLNALCSGVLTQVFTIGQLGVFFTHGLARQLKAMCVVHEPIQDGIGERVIADAGIALVVGS